MNIFRKIYILLFLTVFLVLKTENCHQIPQLDFDGNATESEQIGFFYEVGMEIGEMAKLYFILPSNGFIGQIANWQTNWAESDVAFEKFNILHFFDFFYYFLIILQFVTQFYQKLRKNRTSKRLRTNRNIYFMANFQNFKMGNQR